MISLVLRSHARARVWLAELPEIEWYPAGVLEAAVDTARNHPAAKQQLAVEAAVPVGPRTMYGLLGVTFAPGADALTVRVPFAKRVGPQVPWALTARPDRVHGGLPEEYAPSVLAGALESLPAGSPGVVEFSTAAHDEVGSSNHFMRALARTVIRILSVSDGAFAEARLREIVEDGVCARPAGRKE